VGRDFYVDDVLTGANTVEEAMKIRDETIKVLRAGAFELGKWASNCPDLLVDIKDQNNIPIEIDNGPESSILGIHWNFKTRFIFFIGLTLWLRRFPNEPYSPRFLDSSIFSGC